MKKYGWCLLWVLMFSFLNVTPAFAEVDIWKLLAAKGALIGSGLQQSGYMIAGIGLLFFTFMAIFNKISWKNLAYIMLSCFVLAAMVGLVNYFSAEGANPPAQYGSFTGPDADTTWKGGVPVAKGSQPK